MEAATSALVASAARVREKIDANVEEALRRAADEVGEAPAAAGLAAAAESSAPTVESTKAVLEEAARENEIKVADALKEAAANVDADVAAAATRLDDGEVGRDRVAEAANKLVEGIVQDEDDVTNTRQARAHPRHVQEEYSFDNHDDTSDSEAEEAAADERRKKKLKEIRALGRTIVTVDDKSSRELAKRMSVDRDDDDFGDCGEHVSLLKYAFHGNLEKLERAAKRFYREGLGCRAALLADERGRTVLHLAALRGHAHVILALGRAWRDAATQARDAAIDALRLRLACLAEQLCSNGRTHDSLAPSQNISLQPPATNEVVTTSFGRGYRLGRGEESTHPPHLEHSYGEAMNAKNSNAEDQHRKRKPGLLSEALMRDEYEWCAAEADREFRACELRVEAAWRAALSARDDVGRTPIHYAATCDVECALPVIRALLNDDIAGNLVRKSPSLSKARETEAVKSTRKIPMVTSDNIVKNLLKDPTKCARDVCADLFLESKNASEERSLRWHPPGSLSAHTKRFDNAKRTSSKADLDHACALFPFHERFDASNGKLSGSHEAPSKRSASTLTSTTRKRGVWSSQKHGAALIKWLRKAIYQRAMKRVLSGKSSPTKRKRSAHFHTVRVFERHDKKRIGALDLSGFDNALQSFEIRLPRDTIEEIAAHYQYSFGRAKCQTLIDYVRVVDDAIVDQDRRPSRPESSSSSSEKNSPSLEWSSSEDEETRKFGDGPSVQQKRLEMKRFRRRKRRGQHLARDKSIGSAFIHSPYTYSKARELAEVTLRALGPMLSVTKDRNQPSLSAQMWTERMNQGGVTPATIYNGGYKGGEAPWLTNASYPVGRRDILEARAALLNAHDDWGYTSLHVASYHGASPEVITILLRWGAHRALRADDNSIAEDLAASHQTRRSLRKFMLRDFDREFVGATDTRVDDKKQVKGFSRDRMPGYFYEDAAKTLADSRFAMKIDGDEEDREKRVTATLEMIANAAIDACDADFNRRAGNCGAPSLSDKRPDFHWRRVPNATNHAEFDMTRRALRRCDYFDPCAFPLDRAIGDGRLRTPLHLAAEAGLVDVVKKLVLGWKVTQESRGLCEDESKSGEMDSEGKSDDHESSALLQVRHGRSTKPCFELDAHDGDGWTALHHACARGGEARRNIVRLLLEAGAKVDSRTLRGRTPLHLAAASAQIVQQASSSECPRDEDVEIVNLICRCSKLNLIDSVDDAGETALMIAAARGRVGCASALLAHGANAWYRHSVSKSTALHSACMSRSPCAADAARLLSQWCCGGDGDLNAYIQLAQNEEACSKSDSRLDHEFPTAGFLPFSIDASSVSFMTEQKQQAVVAPAHRLDGHDGSTRYDRVLFCAQKSRRDLKKTSRIAATPLAAARDAKGNTPRDAARSAPQREALDHLWAAAMSGSLVRLKRALQIERGQQKSNTAKVDKVKQPWQWVSANDKTPIAGRTALHLVALGAGRSLAASKKRTEGLGGSDYAGCAQCLVASAHANVDSDDGLGRTPLHYAAAVGSVTVATTLISAGADVRVTDERLASTPLHLARAWNRQSVSRLLYESGASTKARDRKRRTPREVSGLKLA